jgi:hypothetical protein
MAASAIADMRGFATACGFSVGRFGLLLLARKDFAAGRPAAARFAVARVFPLARSCGFFPGLLFDLAFFAIFLSF